MMFRNFQRFRPDMAIVFWHDQTGMVNTIGNRIDPFFLQYSMLWSKRFFYAAHCKCDSTHVQFAPRPNSIGLFASLIKTILLKSVIKR